MRRLRELFLVTTLVTLFALSLSGCAPSNYKLSSSCNPDAGGTISPASGTYQKEVGVDVTATPASGYRFDHWEGGASGTAPTVHLVMGSNKNLIAYFTKTYVLSASCSPAIGGSVSPTSGTYDEGVNTTLIASPAQYYEFNGWAGDASGSSDHLNITMDSNKTIVASFTKITYSLSTQVDPSGSGSIDPSSGIFDAGTQKTVTATPASGYRFAYWQGSASGNSLAVHLVMDIDKNLTAYFTKIYTLAVSCTPTSSGSVSPSSGTYDEGSEVTLVATPAQYYVFSGWGGDASGSSDHLVITMNSNKMIVASFTKITYSLSTQVDPSGSGNIDPSSGIFDTGTNMTITATPASGYRFDHWGGSASGTSNTVSILMNSNKTVTAYFTRVYTLTVSCSPIGSGTTSPSSGVYDAGTVVTLTATALFPYAFDHWSGTNNDTANPTTLTMNANKSPVAYFTELTPGPPQSVNVHLWGDDSRIPIALGAGQWVQGAFMKIGYDPVGISVRILDPASAIMGTDVDSQSFTFQAAHGAGTYYVDIYKNYFWATTDYTFTYTIYS